MTIKPIDEEVLYAKTVKLHTLDLGDGRTLRIIKTIEDDDEFPVHECDWDTRTTQDEELLQSLSEEQQDELDQIISELI